MHRSIAQGQVLLISRALCMLRYRSAHLVNLPTWKAKIGRMKLLTPRMPMATCSTHLTSPPCILSFPRTSNTTPGFSFTLHSGMSTAAPVSVTWESSLAFFSSERMIEIPLAVRGECNDRCGDVDEGGLGFGKLLARANGLIGRIILLSAYPRQLNCNNHQ